MPPSLENCGGSARGPVGLGFGGCRGVVTFFRDERCSNGRATGCGNDCLSLRGTCCGVCATTTRDTDRAMTKPSTATCARIKSATAAISQMVLLERFAMYLNQD